VLSKNYNYNYAIVFYDIADKDCFCGESAGSEKAAEPIVPVVPDFTGQTIREALARISRYRRKVEISGQGRIVAQQPAPGSRLEPGVDFVFKLSSEI